MNRSIHSRTQSEVSSIASRSRDASVRDDNSLGDHNFTRASKQMDEVCQPNTGILTQISDILENYGSITSEGDLPTVLLSVVTEMEQLKRDRNFKNLLLQEYSEVVLRRFSLYGEDKPPTIAEVEHRLKNGSCGGPKPSIWLEAPLNELRHAFERSMESCLGKKAETIGPLILPDSGQTKSSVLQLLSGVERQLNFLTERYLEAQRPIIAEGVDRCDDGNNTVNSGSTGPLNLVAQTKKRIDTGSSSGMFEFTPESLQPVVDCLPASLQLHFRLQESERASASDRRDRLIKLVKFLLSEYLSMERYMENVDKQSHILAAAFHIPFTDRENAPTAGDEQIENALSHSLRALQETIKSVCSIPHHISAEEVALRRDIEQAVGELAQLLTESRRAGAQPGNSSSAAVAAAARIEPPTNNLLDMVQLVRSRFITMVEQQHQRELVHSQCRSGAGQIDEVVKRNGKAALQIVRDICSVHEGSLDRVCGGEESDAVINGEVTSEWVEVLEADRPISASKLDGFLLDVVERLKLIKTRYYRTIQTLAAAKTRQEASAQKYANLTKKLHKMMTLIERIGRNGLGINFAESLPSGGDGGDLPGKQRHTGTSSTDNEEGREQMSSLRRLNLRASIDNRGRSGKTEGSETPQLLTEQNVLDALHLVESRLDTIADLKGMAALQEEVEQLRVKESRWAADSTAFQQAMSVLVFRLAHSGQLVKQTLYLLGTDESAKDEVVEDILQREAMKGRDGSQANPETSGEEGNLYSERMLAELMQKYTRWAQRLQQTTEDHLYTQRKIAKYFTAVRRFFTSQGEAQQHSTLSPDNLPDDNLYDIDSGLMRSADYILPALDRAIREAEQPQPSNALGHTSSAPVRSSDGTPESAAESRREALAQLVRDSTATPDGGVLPYDHRVARMYEMVVRLHTLLTSLLRVHYLNIPNAVRRRSSGDTELIFEGDGAESDAFVDIDLDRLIRVSSTATERDSTGSGASAQPERFSRDHGGDSKSVSPSVTAGPLLSGGTSNQCATASTISANNDVILRVTYQNMEVLHESLQKFSSNHKMAAIVLQKDMDGIQNALVSMLEKCSGLVAENVFGQNRDSLRDLYTTLKDRSECQKGCYFFNRVNGEGSAPWVVALEHLLVGFHGIVDKLIQRTVIVEEYRDLVEEVVDLCALYVSWVEQKSLPDEYALTSEVLGMCVRENESSTRVSPTAVGDPGLPPKPPGAFTLTPRDSHELSKSGSANPTGDDSSVGHQHTLAAKVSRFTKDEAVVKVVRHMFQLAQSVMEREDRQAPRAEVETAAQVLEEEVQLLRETVSVSDKRVEEMARAKQLVELERDKAQSEAAVARAELRRWKRQFPKSNALSDANVTTATAVKARHSPKELPLVHTEKVPTEVDHLAAFAAATGMDRDSVRDVLHYMKEVGRELRSAKEMGQRPKADLAYDEDNQEREELVRSPKIAGGAHTNVASGHRYSALQEQLERDYGTTPMVVIDPDHWSRYASHTQVQSPERRRHRYSPLRYQGFGYDMCDTYMSHHGEEAPEGADVLRQRFYGLPEQPTTVGHLHQRRAKQQPYCTKERKEDEPRYSVRLSRDDGLVDSTRRFMTTGLTVSNPRETANESKEPLLRRQRRSSSGYPTVSSTTPLGRRGVPPSFAAASPREGRWVTPTRRSSRGDQGRSEVRFGGVTPHRVVGGRMGGSEDLRNAIQQIDEEVMHHEPPPSTRNGVSDFGERGTASPEQYVSRNANLRAAALRRLAEVVSQTKVGSSRSNRVAL